jgi:hypothetical protein
MSRTKISKKMSMLSAPGELPGSFAITTKKAEQ